MNEPGTLSLGENEVVKVDVEGESYRIEPAEVKALLFYGRVVPITQVHRKRSAEHEEAITVSIEGHAAMNRSGKAVLIHTRSGHFIIPLISFQRVARGEAVSAPLFPLIPDYQGGQG
jgi:hypothetical protein